MSAVFNSSSTCSTPKSKSVSPESQQVQTPSSNCNPPSPSTPPNCVMPPIAHLANAPKRLSQRKYVRPLSVIPMKSL